MLHKLTSKLLFACPNAHWFPHFFGFPVSHACLLWVAAIFLDKRSTMLLPKPLSVLKCTTLLNLSGILCCELVHLLTWSILAAKLQINVSRRFVYQKALGVGSHKKDIYNLRKHENMTKKVVQLGLSCDGEGKSFPVGSPLRIQAPKLFR